MTDSILIIGAGLAGACSARALAERGWQVQVVDAAAAAAQGASALPVGLMADKKNGLHAAVIAGQPDWDGLGMACTRRWLERFSAQGLLQRGLDWQACGSATNMSFGLHANPSSSGSALAPESEPASSSASTWAATATADWAWQAEACWVKPARLVAASLAHPNIACTWNVQVQALTQQGDGSWQLLLADGRAWQSQRVLLAASVGSLALLRALPPGGRKSALLRLQNKMILTAVAGQALYGPWPSAWNALLPLPEHAPHACNGHGHFIPAVPSAAGDCWLSGATYLHEAQAAAADTDAGQAENLQRLTELLPDLAAPLAAQAAAGAIQRFNSVRCTTPNRLPVLEALAPGLWLNAGFGSRGLSHAPLAAEHLAEHLAEQLAQALHMAEQEPKAATMPPYGRRHPTR